MQYDGNRTIKVQVTITERDLVYGEITGCIKGIVSR
jgi:hypothetical protein